ncbi:MAG: 5'/3'-nucleotidase SurE [Polyangiaceae bacterium]
MPKPLILLANDDGFRAEGLQALRGALAEVAEVVVCAPASEQSAKSHSLTLHRPLRLVRHEAGVFSVDGTPADCVYVALHSGDRVVPRRPDLVMSGLNHGVNLGDDVFYSGTVAAAREAALKGVPAIAVSADNRANRSAAVRVAAAIAQSLLRNAPGELALLNVNFPAGSEWKLAATRLGTRRYLDAVEFRQDPRGKEYLWIGGSGVEHNTLAGSDTEAFDRGEVGVTPLVLDLWRSAQQSLADQVVADSA